MGAVRIECEWLPMLELYYRGFTFFVDNSIAMN
jgi:hypothetical protein